MRNLNKIVLLFIPLASSLSAQQVPVGARTGTARRVMGDRDNGKGVASLFEKTRSTLKAPHVGRISSTLRSEEHTSELQSHHELVCRLLLEKKQRNLLI